MRWKKSRNVSRKRFGIESRKSTHSHSQLITHWCFVIRCQRTGHTFFIIFKGTGSCPQAAYYQLAFCHGKRCTAQKVNNNRKTSFWVINKWHGPSEAVGQEMRNRHSTPKQAACARVHPPVQLFITSLFCFYFVLPISILISVTLLLC